jgi:hypothetical protein
LSQLTTYPPRLPPAKKGNGGHQTSSWPPAPSSVVGSGHFKRSVTAIPQAKTCFRRCPDFDNAYSSVAALSAAAVADSVPRDPARAVTLDGKPHCKNAGTNVRVAPRTPRNSQADRSSAQADFCWDRLGAGPRASLPRQLMWLGAVGAAVVDNAVAVRVGVPGRECWPDTVGWPASVANAAPSGDTGRCNTALGDAPA